MGGPVTQQRLQIAGNSLPNGYWMSGCLDSIFTVRINWKSFLDCTFRTRKVLTQIFGNVRCPILRIKTNSSLFLLSIAMLHQHCGRLNWKLKISNTADNAGITQS